MFLVCLNKVLCKTGEMKAFVLPGDMNSVILTLNPQPLGWRKGVDVLGVEGRREGNLKKKKKSYSFLGTCDLLKEFRYTQITVCG